MSFITSEEDKNMMKEVEETYKISIKEMPKSIEESDLRKLSRISELYVMMENLCS